MKSYIRFIGIPIFVFILFKVDTYKLIEIITEIDLVYLLISTILNIPQLFIKSFRWNLLLKKQGINYSFLHSFMVFLNSLYVGLITPGRIGEFIRVIYLKQDKGVSISKGACSCSSSSDGSRDNGNRLMMLALVPVPVLGRY